MMTHMNRNSIRCTPIALALAALSPASPVHAETASFTKETAENLPGYNIYRPTDLDSRNEPAPVIVWANGGCVKRDTTWSNLFERWAGAGYVVVTIHDENWTMDMAAMARMRSAAGAGGQAASLPAELSPEARARMRELAGVQAKDATDAQRTAIDWAFAENAAEDGTWQGKLDTSRVVAAGNSCGGISSLNLAATEPRVKSVYVLSGSSIGPGAGREVVEPVMNKVMVPAIWIVGGPEDIARAASDLDYSLQPEGTPGVVVYRNAFDHPKVSTDAGSLRDAAEMGLLWFRATLDKDREAAHTLTTTVCEGCDAATWTVKAKHFGTAD